MRKEPDYEALDRLIDDTFGLDEESPYHSQTIERNEGNPSVLPEKDVKDSKDEALPTRQRQRLRH